MRIFLASTDAAWRILRQRQLQSLGQGSSGAYIWVHTVRTGKEKKFDCRLVTLGLVVDEQGFAKHSQLFFGSKSECGTLKGMSEAGALAHEKKGMTVILDAGIATAKNGDGACGWIWIWICLSKLLLGRALLEAGKNQESDAIFNACIQENPDIKAQIAVFKTMVLG